MQYPQQIIDEIDKYANNPIFYILEIESDTPTYKFGITIDIKTRIRTHCRTLNVKRIIKLLDCKYDSVMRSVETNFKRYAKSIGIMVTKFEQTEILITNDINKYIAYIEDKINWELLRPQPKNNRTAEKIKVCNPDIIPVAENNNIANNTLTCNKCGKEFSLEHHLNRHNARKTPCVRPENNFKCQKCNMC